MVDHVQLAIPLPPCEHTLIVALRYRYQLSAFVQKVHGRDPQTWVSGEDSVANARWIEEIYKAVRLHLDSVYFLN
jgi:hypothetical protein